MTPQQFIKQELTALAATFPHIQIRYGFDTMIDTHIVQLDPVKEYYHNEELDTAWITIAMAFNEQFEDSISFISSDSSLLKLETTEMEWNIPVSAYSTFRYYNEIVSPLLQPNGISYHFPNVVFHREERAGLINIHNENRIIVKSGLPVAANFSLSCNLHQTIVSTHKQKSAMPEEGNTQYAMAA